MSNAKGPLTVQKFGDGFFIYDSNGSLFETFYGDDERTADNVRRVVALWGACDGIPTDALERGVIGKSWLPHDYGKKAYRDMSTQEKEIVETFEGKASYQKHENVPLFAPKNMLAIAA